MKQKGNKTQYTGFPKINITKNPIKCHSLMVTKSIAGMKKKLTKDLLIMSSTYVVYTPDKNMQIVIQTLMHHHTDAFATPMM